MGKMVQVWGNVWGGEEGMGKERRREEEEGRRKEGRSMNGER